ncbi:MAG: hypothetical protein Q8920_04450 [Bacillota bacterium]|nr:hypothetical protein [Bacillota bacterium]
MPNTIAYAAVFQQQLDQQMLALLTSGWMEVNSAMVKYNGGNTVKIPKIVIQGLGDYDRSDGFKGGSVTLSWEDQTFTQDRARSFTLDSQDVDESNFSLSAGMVMGEFQRTKVAPEIDAYRYSKIATIAIAANKAEGGYTAATATILAKLKAHIALVQDIIGENEPLVITLSTPVAAILDQADKIEKFTSTMELKIGEASTKVKSIDSIPLIKVPSARMKTAYTFYDGETEGQEDGGFVPAAGAKKINWIISARKSAIGVTKAEKPRIFDPDTNQKADAWKIDYRRYHDLFIPDNAKDGLYVCVEEALE